MKKNGHFRYGGWTSLVSGLRMIWARLEMTRLRSVPVFSVISTAAFSLSRHWATRQEMLRTSRTWLSHLLLPSRDSH